MSNTTINLSSNLSRPAQTEVNAPLNQVAAQSQNAGSTQEAGKPFLLKTDQATLSGASGLVAKALSVPDVRAEKVANLQEAIAAGTYNVSSSDVAGKLLQSLLG